MKLSCLLRRAGLVMALLLGPSLAALAAPSEVVPLQVSADRSTTLTLWAPAKVRGVVLFSSGHGAWPERYEALLQSWADAGFVVLAPMHVDSMKYPQREKFSLQQGLVERFADMRAASGYATAHWPGMPVAAAGHSLGTLVSAALGGGFSALGPLRDPSVVAVLGFSSPGKVPGLVDAQSYASLAVPLLLVTGDQDLVPGFVNDPVDHLYPVETAATGDKTGVVLAGADHNLVGGEPEALFRRARELGTAFLRVHLLHDEQARGVLSAPALKERWVRH